MQASKVDWAAVHEESYLYEDQCWTTCGGGFCCSNNHPDLAFQLIPTEGTTLLYMESEYEFHREHGLVLEHTEGGTPPHEIEFDFGGARPLKLIQTPCHLLGKCDGIVDKPLLCKLYPFLPIPGVNGGLNGLVSASIFELTFEFLAGRTDADIKLPVLQDGSPCTVKLKANDYSTAWEEDPTLLDALRHPYIIFHLQSAKLFAENYMSKLSQCDALAGMEGRDFWKRWELQYLSGKLVDGQKLREEMLLVYNELVQCYGEFLES